MKTELIGCVLSPTALWTVGKGGIVGLDGLDGEIVYLDKPMPKSSSNFEKRPSHCHFSREVIYCYGKKCSECKSL